MQLAAVTFRLAAPVLFALAARVPSMLVVIPVVGVIVIAFTRLDDTA